MSKRLYSEFLSKDDPLVSNNEFLEDALEELQNKLGQILENQNEILTRLCQLTCKGTTANSYNTEEDYFPVTDPEELPNLDANLSQPGKKYANVMHGILRPEGRKEPLKKNFAKVFECDVLMSHNYDGVSNKQSFKQYKQINKTIFGILKTDGYTKTEYVADVRAAFHMLKARYHKRKHDLRMKIKRFQKCQAQTDWE
ncbi:uncharacterized protein LOC108029555 [Drosophila biarmipes]|uniref:uncharacterized protein LOC108029555 n=1 Tax=Drosophila biarmipes TaxID=125945 RepID=UPI0007E5D9D7|nr:uncharacterized protein LOC108029555 [Drosophila biarmipes]